MGLDAAPALGVSLDGRQEKQWPRDPQKSETSRAERRENRDRQQTLQAS